MAGNNPLGRTSTPREQLPRSTSPTLFGWGSGSLGQLGLGPDKFEDSDTPLGLPQREGITSIDAGGFFTLLLDADGQVGTSRISQHLKISWLYG